ncbi:2-octaprenyl-6-methoxyphenol hydroxylase /2-octaprenyl-3-methyl-6-methoxy-1,4-benzoquinol hydroxylase [Palleronia marisminoris]|uniref:2-octaprenyl-6-methoxyphenol hydroxylase n=1 Tax=Palleronia marisminoris TaxID=315423 RepID=A0A1Y5SLE3_9RHOB|nr:2-octaprenyl-6-methoxyphenol hydroxylase /2-octaprenyl-3-methyl-6-methoxy-1,4-benzoquinol hydroxylase [Palleronia marisminoris]SLN42903.1 2-octaprenyl-6-methoxyphenol hydroxylase [Palleronia marisminoris]
MDKNAARAIVRFMDYDVILAGGGLAGSALAIALSQSGLAVALVDPVPATTRGAEGFDGRSYALSIASRNLLVAIGVWGAVSDDAQPILDIRISDGRAGEGPSPLTLHFDHAEIEEGPMGHMVEDRHLRPALLDALGDVTRIEAGVTAQEPGPASIRVTLTTGETLSARVLIGCDGKRSGVAQRAGIRRTGWDYSQSALVAAISHEGDHEGVAHQFFMPEGPLAVLPLKDNRSSIVWTERRDRAEAITALPDEQYLDVLRPRFGKFLGDIALAGARFTYPLGLSVANRFAAPRVALAGDAAHAVHPIAGQGLNAGLKDVAALAEILVEAKRRGEDIGRIDVLERYERWRRFDVATLALSTDGVNRLFSNDNPALRLARDLGLGVVQRLPGLRRGFIREAAGLTGDNPKLLQGRQI